jgi:hypothetical protein
MANAARTPPASLLAALLAALALSACRLAPEGSCAADGDCATGRHCAESVCVPDGRSDLYAGCIVDKDCDPHAQCTRGVCVLLPGRCASAADCQAWESCEATHCALLPGRCRTLDDCAEWEICVGAASTSPPLPEHRCAPAPGRCASGADCPGWQICTAARFCDASACATQDDCRTDLVCRASACTPQAAPPALDPAQVYLVGTLQEGTPGLAAIASPGSPASKVVGLADGDAVCGARLQPDGTVLLGRGAALARLVADPFTWSTGAGQWTYPAAPSGNDAAVAPPAGCAPSAVVLQAGTGARLFECAPLVWRDASGATIVTLTGQPLVAWNSNGMKLAGVPDMPAPPVLLDPWGTPVPVAGLDAGRVVAWRAAGLAFRVAVATGPAGDYGALEVWTIAAGGAATREPALPALPAAAASVGAPVLDAAGAVHQLGLAASGDGLVVKRVPGATAAVVVYDEAALPAGTSLLDAPVRVDGSSCLLTGP